MIQYDFALHAVRILKADPGVIGLTAGGSWLTKELDEFSDLDLILVTKEKISDDKEKMIAYARQLGNFLSGFTGDHVGERRLLICLYDDPLLHVDIKFLTLEEFSSRVETPVLLLDKENQLQSVLDKTTSAFPLPDHQWIEDRFWIWIHYTLLKIGRGEYFEAMDALGFLRGVVLGPLLHMKNGRLPRGVRKVETSFPLQDFEELKHTIAGHDRNQLLQALAATVELYRKTRMQLHSTDIILQTPTEKRVMDYFQEIAACN